MSASPHFTMARMALARYLPYAPYSAPIASALQQNPLDFVQTMPIYFLTKEVPVMANISPNRLVLQCYGYKTKGGKWFGLCLNFNLGVEANSPDELRLKMHQVIESYIETVLDTEDKPSIPELLCRRAPMKDWLMYYGIKAVLFIRNFPNNFTFKEALPFHLSSQC